MWYPGILERNPFDQNDGSEPARGEDPPDAPSELCQVVGFTRKPVSALDKGNTPPARPEQPMSLLIKGFPLAESVQCSHFPCKHYSVFPFISQTSRRPIQEEVSR